MALDADRPNELRYSWSDWRASIRAAGYGGGNGTPEAPVDASMNGFGGWLRSSGVGLAIFVQIGAGIWYASQLDARMHAVEESQKQQHDATEKEFGKLEAAREGSELSQVRIEDKLDEVLRKLGVEDGKSNHQ